MTHTSEARREGGERSPRGTATFRALLIAGWIAATGAAVGVRLWNALAGPLMWGYDAWGHVAYVLFLDIYRAVPWADQGWSYFHPPLHYALGWALARFGSGEVLMRGLSLLGSAASLGTAALAAQLVRSSAGSKPGMALLAFCAVAFLPVHLFMSPMPGNEMTETFLTAAAIGVFVANERRERPTLIYDAAAGFLVGLALLAKFSGLIPLAVIAAALALRPLAAPEPRRELARVGARVAVLAGLALAMAAPYYARNAAAFGTPFQLSRDYPLVAQVERGQPPGARSWRDYVTLPSRMLSDPDPRAPHMLHCVWGPVYLNVWADIYRETDVVPTPASKREMQRSTARMALLGLLPTALALGGAGLAARDAWHGRRRALYLPMLLLSAASLAAFVAFAWRVPLWSALKASYLLGLSLPFAVFAARGAEALASCRSRAFPLGLTAALLLVAVAAAVTGVEGAVLSRRADAPATGAVRFHFGEYDAARRVYGRLVAGGGYAVPWLENLAAVELADGYPARARQLYQRAVALARSAGRSDPYRDGRLAVATALDGDLEAALGLLDRALASEPRAELLANRGAIRAALGQLAAAEEDLLAALEAAPAMVCAWRNLAAVLEGRGEPERAGRARARAEREACRGPRGYPYGLGTGEILEWGVGRRWLLLLEGARLRAALPADYRNACRQLRAAARAPATAEPSSG